MRQTHLHENGTIERPKIRNTNAYQEIAIYTNKINIFIHFVVNLLKYRFLSIRRSLKDSETNERRMVTVIAILFLETVFSFNFFVRNSNYITIQSLDLKLFPHPNLQT